MSGIFGLAGRNGANEDYASALSSMGIALQHKPWMQVQQVFYPDLQVGLGRQDIGVFNRGPLEASSEDGRCSLVLAGELYETQSLRRQLDREGVRAPGDSDAQLLLSLYLLHGPGFAAAVEGIFIAAILDLRRGELLLVNDRFGLYPCYYTAASQGFYFSPSVKSVVEGARLTPRLHMASLAEYMRFQHLLGDKTFFEDVMLLPNASTLTVGLESGTVSITPYWDMGSLPAIRSDISFADAAAETARLLRRSVEKRSPAGSPPVGVYLTGGMDSRTILGLLDRKVWPEVHTFTFGRRDCLDVYYAAKVARASSAVHHWFDMPDGSWVKEYADLHLRLTEGFHSWIHAHGMHTFEQAREFISVNLSGLAGGLVMAGDDVRPLLNRAPDTLAWANHLFWLFNQKNTWPSLTEAEEKHIYTPDIHRQVDGLAYDSFFKEVKKFEHYDPVRRTEFFLWKHSDRRLFQTYTLFYSAFIEMRYPFYDYDLFDFVFSLPPEYRAGRRLYRAVMEREVPRLANIPYDKDGRLPTTNRLKRDGHYLVTRAVNKVNRSLKLGLPQKHTLYADYEHYLRHELRDWAEQILFHPQAATRQIFNQAALHSLLARHDTALEEWTIGKIAPIITFEMMARYFNMEA